mmetsp:Transcript_31892/g.52610  ORF Transcript_31892/g.52610 Transcript_31892/m.52610 type:complete len:93 (+) Transcript_31892:941-1219(+)
MHHQIFAIRISTNESQSSEIATLALFVLLITAHGNPFAVIYLSVREMKGTAQSSTLAAKSGVVVAANKQPAMATSCGLCAPSAMLGKQKLVV